LQCCTKGPWKSGWGGTTAATNDGLLSLAGMVGEVGRGGKFGENCAGEESKTRASYRVARPRAIAQSKHLALSVKTEAAKRVVFPILMQEGHRSRVFRRGNCEPEGGWLACIRHVAEPKNQKRTGFRAQLGRSTNSQQCRNGTKGKPTTYLGRFHGIHGADCIFEAVPEGTFEWAERILG
jgi:hypothetical protein